MNGIMSLWSMEGKRGGDDVDKMNQEKIVVQRVNFFNLTR